MPYENLLGLSEGNFTEEGWSAMESYLLARVNPPHLPFPRLLARYLPGHPCGPQSTIGKPL